MQWAAVAGLLIVALTACGDLPRPFHPSVTGVSGLTVARPDWGGVVVEPVAGPPEPVALAMAEAMAEALRAREIPASTDMGSGNARSLVLESRARAMPGAAAVGIDAEWVLRDRKGAVVAEADSGQQVPPDALARPAPDRFGPLVDRPAARLAAAIVGDPAPRPTDAPKLWLGPITGAPGDGDRALRAALKVMLPGMGVPLASAEADNLVLRGTVDVAPMDGGQERVVLTWRVMQGDREVGKVDQGNVVPAGSLDGHWGGIAYAAAEGAASGIADLLRQIDWQKVAGPPAEAASGADAVAGGAAPPVPETPPAAAPAN